MNIRQECIEMPRLKNINKAMLDDIFYLCNQLEACWEKVNKCSNYWASVKRGSIDPYTAEEILLLSKETAECYEKSIQQRESLSCLSLDCETEKDTLCILKKVIEQIADNYEHLNIPFIKRVIENDALEALQSFFVRSKELLISKRKFLKVIKDPISSKAPEGLRKLANAMSEMGINEPLESKVGEIINSFEEEITSKKNAKEIAESVLHLIPTIKEKKLSVVITFLDIVSAVTKDVLSLRSDLFRNFEAKETILKAEKKAQELILTQERIEELFYAIETIKVEQVEESLSVLVSSGFFSIFHPKYHKAKRFYRSIAKSKSFRKENAIHQIRELQGWIIAIREFDSDKRMRRLLGEYFDGIKTNFIPFVQLLHFYERIDTKLKGVDYNEIRKYLQEGELSCLSNLPQLDEEHPIRYQKENTYVDIVKQIISLETKLKAFNKCKETIIEYSKLLTRVERINSKELLELSFELDIFQVEMNKLLTDALMMKIFDEDFKGPMLLPDRLRNSVFIVEKMVSAGEQISRTILKSLESNQLQANLEIINMIIDRDIAAEDSLNRLSKLINAEAVDLCNSLTHKELSNFLLNASNDKDGLMAYANFHLAKLELSHKGYGAMIDSLMVSPMGLKDLSKTFNALIGQALAKEVYAEFGKILASYNGIKLNQLRKRIAKLDKEILDLSRKSLRVKLQKGASPPLGQGYGRRSEWTNMALLNNEITKRRRFVPARDLTKRAGKALLELKPCWMMSPLAVAQYIEKGDIIFDLLIIDEASQMTPENALGAISRSKQVMIVGDTNQLPPSSFFKKYLDILDEDEDADHLTEESILEMANSVFRPARRLRWHYRSRHPGLIAFSNKYVYDDDLVVFPSPHSHISNTQAVMLHKIEGLYSNGTNPIEASIIANAAIDFMHKHKDMSLGIVLLNQRQRDLIVDEIEYMVAQDSIAQEYVEYWETERDGLESFFIKNLENVQGDERDVIFIGTVYGPEKENAPVMQRFGPINGINGKRRLNVLFSRAKHRIVTFTSMTANDIRVDHRSNEGVALLKQWLEYCASGKILNAELTERKPGSPFEEYVISQLKSMGCQPVPQIGVAGYFIDIGVKHPKWPHGFVMGVECDGASYHSSKSARDRDRLRQEVLEGLGWYLHRIWSTDWFTDPLNEAKNLRLAIELRLEELLNDRKKMKRKTMADFWYK